MVCVRDTHSGTKVIGLLGASDEIMSRKNTVYNSVLSGEKKKE